MQQLHLVGFTTDQEGLIFAARKGSKSGSYYVALDKKLLSKVDEAKARRDAVDEQRGRRRPDRPESILSPREIQARLRSGRTIAQVAREAGVDEEWVARFAAPIQAEQAQVITKARLLVFSKARLGLSAQPLGESVMWNAAEKGVRLPDDVFDDCWSAFHLRDHEWVVRFAYFNRKKTQHAEWEVDLRDGTILARNRLGSELGYVEPGRRRKRLPAAAPPPAAAKQSGRRPARKRAAAKRAATKKRATAKRPAAKRAATKKAPARKAAVRKAAVRKAAVRKAPARKAMAKKTTAKKTTAKKPTAKKAAAKKATAKKTTESKAPAARPPTRVSPPAGASAAGPFATPARPSPSSPASAPPVPRSVPRPPDEPPARPDPRLPSTHPAAGYVTDEQRREPAPIRIVSNAPRREDDAGPVIRAERAGEDHDRGREPVRERQAHETEGLIRLPSPSGTNRPRRRRPLRAR